MAKTKAPKGWNTEWDGQVDLDELDEEELLEAPAIPMRTQNLIDTDEYLADRQNSYRNFVMEMKDEGTMWPAAIEDMFGTSAAFCLEYGLILLWDFASTSYKRLKEMPEGYCLAQIPDDRLSLCLPQKYSDRYDIHFAEKLLEYLNEFSENAAEFERAHKPIDEIIVYSAARITDANYKGLFQYPFMEWAFDLFGDCDVEIALYKTHGMSSKAAARLGMDLGVYDFDAWFEDRFWDE